MNSNFDPNAMPDFDSGISGIAQQHKQQEEDASFDERFIFFKTGNSYRVRLCWPVDPSGVRRTPFIFKNVHMDGGEGRTGAEVVCPTSDYIYGKAGFKACPICAELNRLYNDYKEHGNMTSKALYDQFKRKNRSVLLCYVVSDSSNPKNNGQFMLMRVPKQMVDYLNRNVFGFAVKKGEPPLPESERIGKQAFLMKAGIDLNVNVGTEVTPAGSFNSYTMQFVRNATDVPVSQAQVNQAGIDLKFDEDFFRPFDQEASQKFYKEVMLGMKMEAEIGGGNVFDPTKAQPAPAPSIEAAAPMAQPSVQPAMVQPPPAIQQPPKAQPSSSGPTDIDSILADLNIGK